jgi:hypothetical protein
MPPVTGQTTPGLPNFCLLLNKKHLLIPHVGDKVTYVNVKALNFVLGTFDFEVSVISWQAAGVAHNWMAALPSR